jgi:probable F420-dependent oxidoreductase
MRFDVEVPTCREGVFTPKGFAGPEEIARCCELAEQLGYDTVWATDFLVPTPCYGTPPGTNPNWYEPLVMLAYCAARTRQVRLGTGVLMLPFRDPIVLAKQVATLDRLSNGRFVLGMGLGMCRDEYETVRPRDVKVRRGTMLDESIAILRELLSDHTDLVSFEGEINAFREIRLDPKPIQQPLPMYVPGRAPEALARALRFGLGIMIGATQAEERLAALSRAAEAAGKDPTATDVIAEGELCLASSKEAALQAYAASWQGRFRLQVRGGKLEQVAATQWIGTPAEVVAKLNDAARKGIRHFNVLHIAGDSLAAREEQMQRFAEEVMPHVAA